MYNLPFNVSRNEQMFDPLSGMASQPWGSTCLICLFWDKKKVIKFVGCGSQALHYVACSSFHIHQKGLVQALAPVGTNASTLREGVDIIIVAFSYLFFFF